MYGNLTVICGPMYASKTTELLKRILWARNGQSKAVLVVKPAFDNRFSDTRIVSHDGLSVEAKSITKWSDVETLAADAELVCFDEIQFFSGDAFEGDIVEIIQTLLQRGIDVVASGLDMDWRGKPFLITANLGAMADNFLKLTANCTICGLKAPKTFKSSGAPEQVELGAHDLYEARCNSHWHD